MSTVCRRPAFSAAFGRAPWPASMPLGNAPALARTNSRRAQSSVMHAPLWRHAELPGLVGAQVFHIRHAPSSGPGRVAPGRLPRPFCSCSPPHCSSVLGGKGEALATCTCKNGFSGERCDQTDACRGALYTTSTGKAQCCPAGRRLDRDDVCCGDGDALDKNGRCCIGHVDACGECNGGGIGFDRTGTPLVLQSLNAWATAAATPERSANCAVNATRALHGRQLSDGSSRGYRQMLLVPCTADAGRLLLRGPARSLWCLWRWLDVCTRGHLHFCKRFGQCARDHR